MRFTLKVILTGSRQNLFGVNISTELTSIQLSIINILTVLIFFPRNLSIFSLCQLSPTDLSDALTIPTFFPRSFIHFLCQFSYTDLSDVLTIPTFFPRNFIHFLTISIFYTDLSDALTIPAFFPRSFIHFLCQFSNTDLSDVLTIPTFFSRNFIHFPRVLTFSHGTSSIFSRYQLPYDGTSPFLTFSTLLQQNLTNFYQCQLNFHGTLLIFSWWKFSSHVTLPIVPCCVIFLPCELIFSRC
jgi:hypothetical protein